MILAEALDTLWTLLAAGGLWLLALAAALALVLTVLSLTLIAAARGLGQTFYRLSTRHTHQKNPSDHTTTHNAAAPADASHDSSETKCQNSSITTNPATGPAPTRAHLMPCNYPRTETR